MVFVFFDRRLDENEVRGTFNRTILSSVVDLFCVFVSRGSEGLILVLLVDSPSLMADSGSLQFSDGFGVCLLCC